MLSYSLTAVSHASYTHPLIGGLILDPCSQCVEVSLGNTEAEIAPEGKYISDWLHVLMVAAPDDQNATQKVMCVNGQM